ncbi:MAG TPA: mandelate racemase/muconate lactonizing enzyme family protein [Solirubrobacteraceae bacterium]
MRIVDVTTHVLLDPGFDIGATSSAQDTILVEITTDEGLVGIGETDLNAWVARACIEAPGTHTMDRGLKAMLIGRDPTDPVALWDELYVGSAMTGRRGAVVHAIGALDIALWDLAGKAAGVPTWQLLGAPAHDFLTPYASLQPEVSSFDAYVESMVDWATTARRIGFTAAKLEATFSGPYAHKGLQGPDEWIETVVREVRDAAGPEMTLMVDVQYAFDSVERALRAAEAIAPYDVFFLETPLWPDDLDGYAELRRHSPVRIAQGEWLSTRHEFAPLLERGCVDVAQPDIGRVGGLTEARRVAQMAAEHDVLVVPHAWKTGISVAVAAQLAAVTPHMPFFEFLPAELCESRLRKELVHDSLSFEDGVLGLPAGPGLGFELNRDAVQEFIAAARNAPTVQAA